MNIQGKVHFVSATVQVSEKLTKRELILEIVENPQYPEYLKFETINDRCALLDTLTAGNVVDVHFNLKGREWTNKEGVKQYFNTLALWKVNVLDKYKSEASTPAYVKPVDINTKPEADDLPF